MTNRPSVTIGIPAHNEGRTIRVLLDDLAKQKSRTYSLKTIIVISDGSTDDTADAVKNSPLTNVTLVTNTTRRGLAHAQNQIIEQTTTDILVLLNADIRVRDSQFVENLIRPIVQHDAELTSPVLTPQPPRSFLESVLDVGSTLKQMLYETWRKGQHAFHCQGPARAFSRTLYQRIRFEKDEGEDMYSYLLCIQHGYRFRYVRGTTVFFRNPATLKDHFKQSTRFFTYQLMIAQSLSRDLVDREVKIPFRIYIVAAVKALPLIMTSPIQVVCYVAIVATMFSLMLLRIRPVDLWGASTTKAL